MKKSINFTKKLTFNFKDMQKTVTSQNKQNKVKDIMDLKNLNLFLFKLYDNIKTKTKNFNIFSESIKQYFNINSEIMKKNIENKPIQFWKTITSIINFMINEFLYIINSKKNINFKSTPNVNKLEDDNNSTNKDDTKDNVYKSKFLNFVIKGNKSSSKKENYKINFKLEENIKESIMENYELNNLLMHKMKMDKENCSKINFFMSQNNKIIKSSYSQLSTKFKDEIHKIRDDTKLVYDELEEKNQIISELKKYINYLKLQNKKEIQKNIENASLSYKLKIILEKFDSEVLKKIRNKVNEVEILKQELEKLKNYINRKNNKIGIKNIIK